MARMTQAVADKAAAINARREQRVALAHNNPNLSADGKRIAIARHQLTAYREMDALQAEFNGNATAGPQRMVRNIFGATNISGPDAISFRDAHDRARQIETPEEAATLMQSARNTGDDVLARAVAQRAFEEASVLGGFGFLGASTPWADVLDAFVQDNPELEQQLQEYAQAVADDRHIAVDNIHNAFTFAIPSEPILGAMDRDALEQFVANNSNPDGSAISYVL